MGLIKSSLWTSISIDSELVEISVADAVVDGCSVTKLMSVWCVRVCVRVFFISMIYGGAPVRVTGAC